MMPEPTPPNDLDEVEARAAALQQRRTAQRTRPADESAPSEPAAGQPVPRRLPLPPWQVSNTAVPRDGGDRFERRDTWSPQPRRPDDDVEEQPEEDEYVESAPSQEDWPPEQEPSAYQPPWP